MKLDRQPFTTAELANYVVCPEAWRLKYIGAGKRRRSDRTVESQKLRDEWIQKQDLTTQLKSYAKMVYLLMVLIVIVVLAAADHLTKQFMKQRPNRQPAPVTAPLDENQASAPLIPDQSATAPLIEAETK